MVLIHESMNNRQWFLDYFYFLRLKSNLIRSPYYLYVSPYKFMDQLTWF